jgi:hypothetical protein
MYIGFMSRICASWNIVIILCVFCLLTTGCITQSSTEIVPSSLPSIYTAPIGGFEKGSAILDPNTLFETEYVFSSRSWGPGEVNYTIKASYVNGTYINRSYWCCEYPLNIEQTQLHIEPSSFIAEPNHTYRSRVFLNTSSLPKDFFGPLDVVHGGVLSPVNLIISVHLQDNSTQYGDDKMNLEQRRMGGKPLSWYRLTIENCSVIIKRGETSNINITFQHDPLAGIREISYISSQTPLNVTINPSGFISKHFLEFPSVVTITSNPSLVSGMYPFGITIDGLNDSLLTQCNDDYRNTAIGRMIPVNVTVV